MMTSGGPVLLLKDPSLLHDVRKTLGLGICLLNALELRQLLHHPLPRLVSHLGYIGFDFRVAFVHLGVNRLAKRIVDSLGNNNKEKTTRVNEWSGCSVKGGEMAPEAFRVLVAGRLEGTSPFPGFQ